MSFPTESPLTDLSFDKFGYKEIAAKLVNNLLLEMDLPNTFGVYGNWGTGKSTFLNALEQELDQNTSAKDFFIVRFEPWKYEYAEAVDLFVALIREFKKQADIPDDSPAWVDLSNTMLGMSYSILRQMVSKVTLGIVDPKDMEDAVESLQEKAVEDVFDRVDNIQQLREKLNALVKEVLSKGKKRICILIDDLDRCSPDRTTELLEAIKNFLFADNILFVFAMDRRIVSEMIEKKYGLRSGYGEEYLTKIINYYITLPTPTQKEVLTEILADQGINISERTTGWMLTFAQRFVPETRRFKHLIYQLITQAKLAGVDLAGDNEVDTACLFSAVYFKFRFPKIFNVGRRAALENLRTYGLMVRSERDPHQGNSEDLANQLGVFGYDKKELFELFVYKLPDGNQLMHEGLGKFQEMGFSRMVD